MTDDIVEWDEKVRLIDYFVSEKCLCGEFKRRAEWDCRACSKLNNHSVLNVACQLHLYEAKKYLERTKR